MTGVVSNERLQAKLLSIAEPAPLDSEPFMADQQQLKSPTGFAVARSTLAVAGALSPISCHAGHGPELRS